MRGSKIRKRNSKISFDGGTGENKRMLKEINRFAAKLGMVEKDLSYISHYLPGLISIDEQIKLDTYLAYATSTLFWMNLKLNGSDLSNHYILHDLRRAKDMLAREKEINDSLAAPRLDIAATKRFIASGVHTRFVEMSGIMVTKEQYQRSLMENARMN